MAQEAGDAAAAQPVRGRSVRPCPLAAGAEVVHQHAHVDLAGYGQHDLAQHCRVHDHLAGLQTGPQR